MGEEGYLKIIEALTAILTVVTIALCTTASYRLINVASAIILLTFNLLFISLIFQLNGNFFKKFIILAAGNFLGFFCNFVFYNFSYSGISLFGTSFYSEFNVIYTLIFPFLNLLWIVPFWSFSLSFLIPRKKRLEE